jgi:hypothetical protein
MSEKCVFVFVVFRVSKASALILAAVQQQFYHFRSLASSISSKRSGLLSTRRSQTFKTYHLFLRPKPPSPLFFPPAF